MTLKIKQQWPFYYIYFEIAQFPCINTGFGPNQKLAFSLAGKKM